MAATAAGYDPIFEGSGAEEKCMDRKTGMPIANVSSKYFRPSDTRLTVGDPSRIKASTTWKGSRPLEKLIEEMVTVDIDRWNKGITNV